MDVKKDFPIFKNNPDMVYLDSAATSQKPQAVIDAVNYFYTHCNSNVHRGLYSISEEATELYEKSREGIANFIGAGGSREIVFTANASEAINLVAHGWGRKNLSQGDIVVLTEMEHNSNIVPWIRLKKERGVKLYYLPINRDYRLDWKKMFDLGLAKKRIKLIALTHASNVLGSINPIAEIVSEIKRNKINAKVLVDGAQSIPHIPIDVRALGVDFFVISSHKMLGPSGVGALWAKLSLLEEMDPLMVGSHMIETVYKNRATWAPVPDRFEVGTGRLEGVVGFGEAVEYLNKLGMAKVAKYEEGLTGYALEKLSGVKGLKLFGSNKVKNRLGVFSFSYRGVHPHDVGELLNRGGVCVRVGHHCAQPLMRVLGVPATCRASTYIYNTRTDIDRLVEAFSEVKKVFK